MKRQDTIIHVELHTGEHHYFGSIAAIFTKLTPNQIGVDGVTLYRHKLEPGKPYKNDKCTIRKDYVVHKEGNRRPPVKIIRVS